MTDNIISGLSQRQKRARLREHKIRVLVDDSQEMRGQNWVNTKELLDLMVEEAEFELSFVNHRRSGTIENTTDVVDAMQITPTGTRDILKELDKMVQAEVREMWGLPAGALANRKKLIIVIVLSDMPTDPSPRGLRFSVDYAVTSLAKAQLPTDRISIEFVQIGFSRDLSQALEDVEEDFPHGRPDYTGMVDFTMYAGSTDNNRMWKILLGSVVSDLARMANGNIPVVRTVVAAAPPAAPRPPANPFPTAPSGPILSFPSHFRDGTFQMLTTHDMSAGFTVSGWLRENSRANTQMHDFFTFQCGRLPVFRASLGLGSAEGDSIGIWFPNISAYPTVRGFPAELWTFICIVYDGSEARFGLNGFLSSRTSLGRPAGLEQVHIGIHASNTSPAISLANIKIHNRVLDQIEILSEYSSSKPDLWLL